MRYASVCASSLRLEDASMKGFLL